MRSQELLESSFLANVGFIRTWIKVALFDWLTFSQNHNTDLKLIGWLNFKVKLQYHENRPGTEGKNCLHFIQKDPR